MSVSICGYFRQLRKLVFGISASDSVKSVVLIPTVFLLCLQIPNTCQNIPVFSLELVLTLSRHDGYVKCRVGLRPGCVPGVA
jgi:hypothetical protein